MLLEHNPESIQQYGWSQIEPIQTEIIIKVIPRSPEVTRLVLGAVDRYQSFALAMIKNMNEGVANALVNANGIEVLAQLYHKTNQQMFISLVKAMLASQTSNQVLDVNGLF